MCLATTLLASQFAVANAGTPSNSGKSDFVTTVLPILKARCASCHGDKEVRAGLDVRTLGDLFEGGHSGPAVVSGKPAQSPLFQRIASGNMPPGGKLPAPEIKRIESWIRAGAPGDRSQGGHWAFRPPVHPVVPKVRNIARVRNPLVSFLLAALEAKGLGFASEADRRTLIRRVTFDLIGLPPTPEEVDAFVRDARGDAYERLVDRLLADPRYGERWAKTWLDAAGYADSEGVLQEDRLRPNAWRYRDYVIRSFNADKPYNQFLTEQIAGDEISDYRNANVWTEELTELVTATGFLRTAVDATRDDFNAHQFGEYQYRMLHDTQTIVGTAILGLTVQCARCHNHKYEPLTQRDYYRLQAIFAGGVRPRGKLLPTYRRQIVAATKAEQERAAATNAEAERALGELASQEAATLARHRVASLEADAASIAAAERQALIDAVRADPKNRTPDQQALVAKHKGIAEPDADTLAKRFPAFAEERRQIEERKKEAAARRVTLTEIRAFYDQDADPPDTPILHRGEWLKPGEVVSPGAPAFLAGVAGELAIPASPQGASTTYRRTALARWITDSRNPLTARVYVNRIWAHHFGTGLVETLENFGRSGARPSNRALLDWLACVFVSGPSPWSTKAMHRLIVLSAAYRQSSRPNAQGIRADPENRLLWRQRSKRLDAEAYRDAVLAVAGTLDPKMYGEPVPLETRPTGEIIPVGEAAGGRRSVYLLQRRTTPVSLLNAFDAPVIETNCTRRTLSVTPAQSLAALNGAFLTNQSARLAERVLKEASPKNGYASTETLNRLFELVLGRPPVLRENRVAARFLHDQILKHQEIGLDSPAALKAAYADLAQGLLGSNAFLYLD